MRLISFEQSKYRRTRRAAAPTVKRWSDPSTWPGGVVPVANQDVTIAHGENILLDVSTASLGIVTNMGRVVVLDGLGTELVITCKQWVNDCGQLIAGDATLPFQSRLRIVLTEAYPGDGARVAHTLSGLGFTLPFTRGIMTMDDCGELSLYGKAPTHPWTKLNATAAAAATVLTLKDDVGSAAVPWVAGDQVQIGPDQFHWQAISNYMGGADSTRGRSYTHAVASVSGANLTLGAGLTSKRWGVLQYATGNGCSTDAANATTTTAFALGQTYIPNDAIGTQRLANINAALAAGMRHTIDERTPVANLTRNIVIEAPDDASWQNNGFGCNVMAMRGATMNLHGVEVRRCGQRDIHGRYPIHAHMMSYGQTTPDPVSDADNTYVGGSLAASYARVSIKGCSVHDSWNRGIVIHGSNGIPVWDNVVCRIKGHGIFLEDGVERKNDFRRNLVMKVEPPRRDPTETGWDTNPDGSVSHHLQVHEHHTGFGPAAWWITNPDNNFIDNHACEARTGFWWSHAAQFHSIGFPITLSNKPINELLGTVTGNTAHSCFENNARLELAPTNRYDGGGIQAVRYQAMGPGSVTGITNAAYRPQFLDMTLYKAFDVGYLNRASWTDYSGWVNGDNAGKGFNGSSGETTTINNTLHFVSLNNDITGQGVTYGAKTLYAAGLASYNFGVNFLNNVFLNMPNVSGSTSGAMALDESDLYIRPAELGMLVSVNNALLNSGGGYRRQSDNLAPGKMTRTSALYDPEGVWHPNAETDTWWNVFDVPFLTSGKTTQAITGVTGQVLANGGQGGYFGALQMAIDVLEDGSTCTQATAHFDQPPWPPAGAEYLNWSASNGRMGGQEPEIEFSVQRVASDYTTSIGTWTVEHGRPIRGSLSNMRHFAMVPGGFYKFDPHLRATKPTTTWMAIENCYRTGDIFTLAVRLSVAPDGVFAWGGDRANISRAVTANYTDFAQVQSLASLTAHAGNAWFWDGAWCWAKVKGNPCPGGMYTAVSQQSADYQRWTLCLGKYL